eukprot:TRINITY_DN66882_c1_g2_i1.p1 TRINITY_DN66882_c1_g2~~TRINITY_DN66882_c1_g2_i1.p1  ORF type:complete len:117 (-),score=19.84 TRINITY_DN66882_c1_g2_i1:46-396(-)
MQQENQSPFVLPNAATARKDADDVRNNVVSRKNVKEEDILQDIARAIRTESAQGRTSLDYKCYWFNWKNTNDPSVDGTADFHSKIVYVVRQSLEQAGYTVSFHRTGHDIPTLHMEW